MIIYEALINEIYDEYNLLVNNNDFNRLKKNVGLVFESIDKPRFIKELLSHNFDSYFVSTVFFYLPELWCDLTINSWTDIVNNTVRPHVRPYMDNDGCYYDLFFLNKFLHINPFALLENNIKRHELIIKMLAFKQNFVLSEVETENLEDGTIPIKNLLEKTFKNLHVKDEFISENRDCIKFTAYLNSLSKY